MAIDRDLSDEEAQLVAMMTRYSWHDTADSYRDADLDQLAGIYAPDAISIPANKPAMWGRDQIRAYYASRTGDFETHVISEVDSVDLLGDLAVMVGTFRITRAPQDGVAAVDHAGRWLAVMRKLDGKWYMWRDMDSPSPDADHLYFAVARGQ